jgi:predicted ATPase
MKITRLHVTNFKSIRDLEITNPNPFSVFVGPNGAGKSNIFEALEFAVLCIKIDIYDVAKLFGGAKSLINFQSEDLQQHFLLDTSSNIPAVDITLHYSKELDGLKLESGTSNWPFNMDYVLKSNSLRPELEQGVKRFSRIFLNTSIIKKINTTDDSVLNLDASNVEQVLNRILQKEDTREEIIEWLQVLIPEFKDIQIETSNLSGEVNYAIYEKHSNKPFPKHLISDGTKNILALLTAVYQSDEPQFLCIEEPENGLHPQVIEALVRLFRNACKEKGHYIWLNTHSQTLVRQLTADEIIVVDKEEGSTRVRQFQGRNLHGLKMDEAWLTNALGGGLI